METLKQNPFADERLKDLIVERFLDSKPSGELNLFALKEALQIIQSLDPYDNPVTKHEFRAWLLDNGFDERETDDRIIKSYENKTTREKLAIVFYEGEPFDWHYSETMTEIEIRASKRNIHPFTLYAEIKLKYGKGSG